MRGTRCALLACALALGAGGNPGVRYDADLGGALRDVAGRLRPIRGAVPARVPLAVRADEGVRMAAARARRDAALSPSRLAARGRAWADIGLGDGTEPADLDLALARDLTGLGFSADRKQVLVDPGRLTDADFGGEQGDPEGAALLFATGVRPDEPAIAHLMTHVLQDERGEPPGLRETTDATLASSALREGEANLVALLLLYGGLGMEAEVLAGSIDPAAYRGGDLESNVVVHGSPVLARLAGFVYGDGFRAAAARTRQGGWRSLEKGMLDSGGTRSLLHPDRPSSATMTVPVPDLVLPEGFALADRDTIGEFGVGVLVAERAGKENLGWIAAEGWEADALFRWEGAVPQSGVTVWVTRWSSEQEASDFRYAMERSLVARFREVEKGPVAGTEWVLRRADSVFRLANRGREVLLRVAPTSIDDPLGTLVASPIKTNTTK